MNRLDAYRQVINEVSSRPFGYGTNDCMLMLARAVYLLTGVDHAAAFGQYDERRAQAWIAKHGGITAFVARFLGDPVPVPELRTCDACMVSFHGFTVGALWSGRYAIAMCHRGMIRVHQTYTTVGFRIG